jgi:hypothetical protein
MMPLGLTGIGSALIPALGRYLIAGAIAGLGGALLFALAHAIVIVPIWDRSGFGFLSGAIAGAVAGWAFAALGFDRAHVSATQGIGAQLAAGARFGGLLWLAVVPVTLADALLRATGVARRYELVAVGVAVVLALSSGALLGWRRARTPRAAIAGASATMLLTMAMAGPVPVGRGLRALTIFLAVLPAAVVGGAIVAAISRALHRAA